MGRSGKLSKTTKLSRGILLGGDNANVRVSEKTDEFLLNQEYLKDLLDQAKNPWSREQFFDQLKTSIPILKNDERDLKKIKKDPVFQQLLSEEKGMFEPTIHFSKEDEDDLAKMTLAYLKGDTKNRPSMLSIVFQESLERNFDHFDVEKILDSQMDNLAGDEEFVSWLEFYLNASKDARSKNDNFLMGELENLPSEEKVVSRAAALLIDGDSFSDTNQMIYERISSEIPSFYGSSLPDRLGEEEFVSRLIPTLAREIDFQSSDPIETFKNVLNTETDKGIASHIFSLLENDYISHGYSEERESSPLLVRAAEVFSINSSASLFRKIEPLSGNVDETDRFIDAADNGIFDPEVQVVGHVEMSNMILEAVTAARQEDNFPLVSEIISRFQSIMA